MKKVLIVGGGFAGLSATLFLSRHKKILSVTLVDKTGKFNFLPTLPDVIGRGIKADHLVYDIKTLSQRLGFELVIDEVVALDVRKKEALTRLGQINYDYLVIASGSETNFYGNEQIHASALKLDDAADALAIRRALEADYQAYLVSGGGYTGIEVATNLRMGLNKLGKKSVVAVVERAPGILGPLPQWMKEYVAGNLRRLGIEVYTGTVIEKMENSRIYLSGGKVFEKALLIWAAGVKTSGFIQNLSVEKNPQGRIKVDEYLGFGENCFAVGDAAFFSQGDSFLRMAVQFSIMQGNAAARNILNSIKGKDLVKYKPVDLGYIIPMANNRSCGTILGRDLKGILPTFLHYAMCVYRSFGLRNKLGIIRDLIKGGRL